LLLLFALCEELWRLSGSYYSAFRRLAGKPASLFEQRRVSGCAFDREPPGWNDLMNYVSRRIPDSNKVVFLPIGPDTPESHSAYCILTYVLFPRAVVRFYPKRELEKDYLASIAESQQSRYLILYRANKNYNPSFAHCRFGEDLFLVDVDNQMSCNRDAN
jgi:hypothetical protein